MTDPLEQQIVAIIQDALRNNTEHHNVLVSADDSMETIAAWDSVTFMTVFLAINEAFGVNPDFDDAIHYTSVKTLHAYIREQLA